MPVSKQTPHSGRLGTGRWVLIGGWVGCWVCRFTTNNTTHHQYNLVERCASVEKPCLEGVHHGLNICVRHHHQHLTFIANYARQGKNHGFKWVGVYKGGGGRNNILFLLFGTWCCLQFTLDTFTVHLPPIELAYSSSWCCTDERTRTIYWYHINVGRKWEKKVGIKAQKKWKKIGSKAQKQTGKSYTFVCTWRL